MSTVVDVAEVLGGLIALGVIVRGFARLVRWGSGLVALLIEIVTLLGRFGEVLEEIRQNTWHSAMGTAPAEPPYIAQRKGHQR